MLKQIFTLLIYLIVFQTISQVNSNFENKITALNKVIAENHFNPKPIDNTFSRGVFELFLENLDYDKRFFTVDDIETFKADELRLDDYISDSNYQFLYKYVKILKNRIVSSKKILDSLSKNSLDYSGQDTILIMPIKLLKAHKNEAAFRAYWSKRVRYKILKRVIETDSGLSNLKTNFNKLESSIKLKVIKSELCSLTEFLSLKNGVQSHVEKAFLNAIANFHDPHTNYFGAMDKMSFENSVAKSQEVFGLVTSKNQEGEIIVTYIVPGSPAFNSGKIDVNDVIKSISNKGSTMELLCVSEVQINEFINDESHRTLTFKIKKQDGSEQDIILTKTKTKVAENSITSYLLSNNNINSGYIKIPSFYTDLETFNGLGVANDVAKELYRLNKENINGLILDLRFNTGGSMKEAQDLCGMFINRGPLSIIKNRNGDTFTLKDFNRGSLFYKPLIIIINEISASASEFFASVMQDYNRAIIVGSTSYGKSTAQTIIPLSASENLGFCKITIEKFYRPTGKSNQSVGVVPDIIIPSIYDGLEISEAYKSHALGNDSINAKFKPVVYEELMLESIKKNSQKRIKSNLEFDAIQEINAIIANSKFKKIALSIKLDHIYHNVKMHENLFTKIGHLNDQQNNIIVKNNASTIERLQFGTDIDKEVNLAIIKDIKNDIYIEEAFSILNDYINTNTN